MCSGVEKAEPCGLESERTWRDLNDGVRFVCPPTEGFQRTFTLNRHLDHMVPIISNRRWGVRKPDRDARRVPVHDSADVDEAVDGFEPSGITELGYPIWQSVGITTLEVELPIPRLDHDLHRPVIHRAQNGTGSRLHVASASK